MEEATNDNGKAMGSLGENFSSSVLSAAIVTNLRKSGMFFTREVEENLTKCINESVEEIQFANSSSLTADVGTADGQSVTLPPLVFQFENPGNESVIMGMMRNGKPEVLKNEEGSDSTPAFAGFIDGKGLVYGTDAEGYRGPRQVWRCVDFWQPFVQKQPFRSVDLKEFGLFTLHRQFFNAFLIRKLKISAEAGCNGGGVCQEAILAVPMQCKSTQRLRLKEAATLAGFKGVYLVSSEGLAAYYWFSQKKKIMEQNYYSRDYVIIDLFGHAVVYKRSFEFGSEGKRMLVVKAYILLDLLIAVEDRNEFREMVKEKLELSQNNSVIPIIRRKKGISRAMNFARECKIQAAVVEDDELDSCEYFAAKGAALLSENPEKIGRQVRNMMGTLVWIDPHNVVTLAESILPETCVGLTLNIKHDRARYRIDQIRLGASTDEVIGYLTINGLKLETELNVDFELNWEGILKVVGVSGKNTSEDDEDFKPVEWDWLSGDHLGFANFGRSAYKECKALLMKVAPSPSQAKVASTNSSGHRNEIQEKKKRSTKSRVIGSNDIIVNTGLVKVKLESDWVERVVKIEQDLMEDSGEGENGQHVNSNEHEVLQVEEGDVKIEQDLMEDSEEGENDQNANSNEQKEFQVDEGDVKIEVVENISDRTRRRRNCILQN